MSDNNLDEKIIYDEFEKDVLSKICIYDKLDKINSYRSKLKYLGNEYNFLGYNSIIFCLLLLLTFILKKDILNYIFDILF